MLQKKFLKEGFKNTFFAKYEGNQKQVMAPLLFKEDIFKMF